MSGCEVCSSKHYVTYNKNYYILFCIPPTGVYSPRGAYSKGRGMRPCPSLPAPKGARIRQLHLSHAHEKVCG